MGLKERKKNWETSIFKVISVIPENWEGRNTLLDILKGDGPPLRYNENKNPYYIVEMKNIRMFICSDVEAIHITINKDEAGVKHSVEIEHAPAIGWVIKCDGYKSVTSWGIIDLGYFVGYNPCEEELSEFRSKELKKRLNS